MLLTGELVSGGHNLQDEAALALYLPSPHTSHTPVPFIAFDLPAEQEVQEPSVFGPTKPELQMQSMLLSLPIGANELGGHLMHPDAADELAA